jgi:hypothetical protein
MQIPSSSLSIENILETHPAGATQDTGKKKTPKEARQLLSCTRCRERKVKVSLLQSISMTGLFPVISILNYSSVIAQSPAAPAAPVVYRKNATSLLRRAVHTSLSYSLTRSGSSVLRFCASRSVCVLENTS